VTLDFYAGISNNDSRKGSEDAVEAGLYQLSPFFPLTMLLQLTKIRDIQHTKNKTAGALSAC
jgi:hypothetical protein